jgi:TetR/AcrR family transcriptional regulator, tetracycline repressor protein
MPDDGGRTRLTRAAVVDRALTLADQSGLDTLTIRKLAADLGVTPMALYWHFRSKEELLGGIADRIWSEIDTEVDWSAPWQDQLRGLYLSLLSVLRAHSSAPQLIMRGKKSGDASADATETALEVLRRAGFSPADASGIAIQALWSALMLVMSEPGIEFADPEERVEEMRKRRITFGSQPVAKYPRLVECAVPMTACEDPEVHYRLGVDIFIGGVVALAATRGEPPS